MTKQAVEFMLFILNQSRNSLENYLLKHSFKNINSCLVLGNGPIVLTAHMDTINTKALEASEDLFFPLPLLVERGVIRKQNEIITSPMQRLMVLGGDDRCGIFLALMLYKTHPDWYTVFFTDEEERGGTFNTANYAPRSLWYHKFVLCLDTHAKSVFPYHDPFTHIFNRLNAKYDYRYRAHSLSNVQHMAGAYGINLGVGYHKEHTSYEHIVLKELYEAYLYSLELSDIIINKKAT